MKKVLESVVDVSSVHTIYDLNLQKDYVFTGESHPFYEINIILEGTLGLTIGDKLYELKKGQACIIPAGEFHKDWVIGLKPVRLFVVTFDMHSTVASFKTGAVYSMLPEDMFYVDTILNEGFNWIRDKVKNPALGIGQIVKNSIESLIISMLRQSPESSVFVSSSGEIFYRAIHYMNMHIKENVTMEEIAEFSNSSVANLKKVFKKYTGSGAIHHFNMLKLEYSKELLKLNTPISEVAFMLSFSSQNHYAQSFKKVFGVTPTQFRKQMVK